LGAKESYAREFLDDAAAVHYDENYRPGTFDAHIHELQATWLRGLCRRYFTTPPTHIDYACGTGRIINALRSEVRAAIGYDVSPAMLSRAQQRCPDAQFVQVSEEEPIEPMAIDGPVVGTMFRLILNADRKTRELGCRFLAAALRRDARSIGVINNHGNSRSLRHLARYLPRRGRWFHEVSDQEMRELFARHDLEVVETFGAGHLTPRAYEAPWLRSSVRRFNELCSQPRILAGLAADVSYVVRAQRTTQ
jgi:hypothetical protein